MLSFRKDIHLIYLKTLTTMNQRNNTSYIISLFKRERRKQTFAPLHGEFCDNQQISLENYIRGVPSLV